MNMMSTMRYSPRTVHDHLSGSSLRALKTPELERLSPAMLRIRLFEEAVLRLFMANEVEGTTHLLAGPEAVSVGVCNALGPAMPGTGSRRCARARVRREHDRGVSRPHAEARRRRGGPAAATPPT